MPAVEVKSVNKTFGEKIAVKDLTFSVEKGELFGLIGPNGAGKSTTMRMMMDVIKPDSGTVTVLGQQFNESTKNKLGYMPEERGLYRKMNVMDTIIYLASLKGTGRQVAVERANEMLNKTGLLAHKKKKIDELSKGMAQIIQYIVTVIHSPEVVVLDEPFSGLDPVNTELLRQMFFELRDQGKVVILSTHRMNEVEELCDRILMINNGGAVLYGGLKEIKARYRSNTVVLEYEGSLGELSGVVEKRVLKDHTELLLKENVAPQQILAQLIAKGTTVNRFEIATPSLNEIFLREAAKK
jgi:ABC-2 type transport system ATP-binding protein